MKTFLSLIVIILQMTTTYSQNLVPNGSFELYNVCPTYISQLNYANSWFPATVGTPDYFNQCAPISSNVNVPNCGFWGFQQAKSGGAYCGLNTYARDVVNGREYIETLLDSTLSSGACYHFEMYINSCDICQYNASGIGVFFSNNIVTSTTNFQLLNLNAQITNSPTNFPDTSSWKLVTGNYSAQGGERYLIIGNFKNDALSNVIEVYPNGSVMAVAYLFIDDVSLTRVNCTQTTITTELIKDETNIYPNPFDDELYISIDTFSPCEITIHDITGNVLIQKEVAKSSSLSTKDLDKGSYIYTIKVKGIPIKRGKIFKN